MSTNKSPIKFAVLAAAGLGSIAIVVHKLCAKAGAKRDKNLQTVPMKLNYADLSVVKAEDFYKIMYVMEEKEFEERGGLKEGEFMDTVIVPGSISRSPIKEIVTGIQNARMLDCPASLDKAGFKFGKHQSAPDLYDFDHYDSSSYQIWLQQNLLPKAATQVMEAASQAFGKVVSVHAIDYTLRCTDGAGPSSSLPVLEAHGDFTRQSGSKRIGNEQVVFKLGDPSPINLSDHPIIINLWQPLVPVVYRKPLVVCDVRSTVPDDYVHKKMVFRHRIGEVCNIKHNQNQQWYYYPKMTINECLMFLTWTPGGMTVPHSGVVDPTDPENSPPRRSMETRWIVKLAAPFKG